jgi:hypothetical protein
LIFVALPKLCVAASGVEPNSPNISNGPVLPRALSVLSFAFLNDVKTRQRSY